MPHVKLRNVVKQFDKVIVVDHISFDVERGDFFTMLGPSGCGKTTTLRMISGFYEPDEGEIYINDKIVNHIPPEKRNCGFVFQSYALFPHMTVFDNVAYGLKIRKIPKDEIKKRVKEALSIVGLAGYESRRPDQLSGGEQQRVALARVLVINPEVLLLDEPLSNLDAKLRVHMRSELRKIQRSLGITTIYVTHDQAEALSMSTKIAVMNKGKIEQIGSPIEIYGSPKTKFVADFMGLSNIFQAKILQSSGELKLIETEFGTFNVKASESFSENESIYLLIRPEAIELEKSEVNEPLKKNELYGKIIEASFVGGVAKYTIDIKNNLSLTVSMQDPLSKGIIKEGVNVKVKIPETGFVILKP
ncbi:MAG: ABC transporter ATP-binding protein [Candidatus Bathyarchaeia archaeon]